MEKNNCEKCLVGSLHEYIMSFIYKITLFVTMTKLNIYNIHSFKYLLL